VRILENIVRDIEHLARTDDRAKLLLGVWRHVERAGAQKVEIGTILSARDGQGKVEMLVNTELLQMDLPKAREIRQMLDGAIEAAVSDELIFRFLVEKVGMARETAARAMLDFREMRQGSRETVRPQ
jgi:hypothetical protein